jgi:hypothetical protein
MVAHTYSPALGRLKQENGELVEGQPGLHRDTPFEKRREERKKKRKF